MIKKTKSHDTIEKELQEKLGKDCRYVKYAFSQYVFTNESPSWFFKPNLDKALFVQEIGVFTRYYTKDPKVAEVLQEVYGPNTEITLYT